MHSFYASDAIVFCDCSVCRLLEEEKCDNAVLRKLWQLTNEQAATQKSAAEDVLKFCEPLLTEEQLQQITCLYLSREI
jgi:hypothetical protein